MSVSFPKPLTEEEERYYIDIYENGDDDAKEEAKKVIIERNLRLGAHVAKKYTSQFHTMDDFISIGTIGLIKAINTYNSGKATRLATYAARCIENEILMTIRASKKYTAEVSINDPIGTDKEGNEISLNDILGTEPDAIIDDLDTKIKIGVMLESIGKVLTEREKYVLIYRYGLFGVLPHTQREVAAMLGISRSYVSRSEKKALACLKGALNA